MAGRRYWWATVGTRHLLRRAKLALEFNGFPHEQAVDAYGGEEHYERIKGHDRRKVDACLRGGVCLVVINFAAVSKNGRQVDLELLISAIWDAVADMRYPLGAPSLQRTTPPRC
jgi:hypothetical protein